MYLILIAMVLTIPFHFWRLLVKNVFSGLAMKGAGLRPGSLKYDKFLEQCWLATHYSAIVLLEIYVLRYKTNIWPVSWQPPMSTDKSRMDLIILGGQMESRKEFEENPWVNLVYLIQFTFYSLELFTLILDRHSRSRSDAFVYAIHHVLTTFLISMSFLHHSLHIGILVLLFHDIGDIFLPIGKCFSYSEDHVKANFSKFAATFVEFSGLLFFVLFIIGFAVPRLLLFGSLIHTEICYDSWNSRMASEEGQILTGVHQYHDYPLKSSGPTLITALFLLYPMHVYWFRLIIRTAINVVFGKYGDDRSDDEYEPETKKQK